ncbi:hypothetical protein [uncultured Bradyrhizobium sp.]|uniref:hypothetical protein n=1 Tax=uncultured Bradyrhizobium sp. TaxID=199684 RepID=UPI00263623AE|nr:hypothetical protein [uncultured Bradyrhizobium sp.]
MNQENFKLTLVIEPRSKAIPYPADLENDRTNQGFKDLKGNPEVIETIAEIRDCPALRDALMALNEPETQFFTVGCEKSLNEHERKFWKRGYLEFSFNYAELVRDATPYFVLFFHFNQAAPIRDFLPKHSVQFAWELQRCHFRKADVAGFTCAVWISTGDYLRPKNANEFGRKP